MYDPKVKFDDMIDPAFAGIYHLACILEKDGKIDPDMDTECMTYECKKLAVEFVEKYDELCKYGTPDYWDMLDNFSDKKLRELWPLKKIYDVDVTIRHTVVAASEEDAKRIANMGKSIGGKIVEQKIVKVRDHI